jgi:hypothetical protein
MADDKKSKRLKKPETEKHRKRDEALGNISLFEPPIDPALLKRAQAVGVDVFSLFLPTRTRLQKVLKRIYSLKDGFGSNKDADTSSK